MALGLGDGVGYDSVIEHYSERELVLTTVAFSTKADNKVKWRLLVNETDAPPGQTYSADPGF